MTNKKPVFCFECSKNSIVRTATKMVPVREGYYDLSGTGADINDTKIPLCAECYKGKNDFQKKHCDSVKPYSPLAFKYM